MTVSLERIKTLREKTGAGVVEVKKALDEASGDEEKAIELLRKSGAARAIKKSAREANEGVVASYVHSNGKIGVLVKVLCETDFVARNEEFLSLAKDIAMHIAAMSPHSISTDLVNDGDVAKEREIWVEQLRQEGKPETMVSTILQGKEKKFREDRALLTQPFVKDAGKTVGEILSETAAKMGENIQVGEFVRFEL